MREIKPKTDKPMMDTPCCSSKDPSYPRFRTELEYLPEAKKWEIGKEYTIALKLKMTGISISRFQNDCEFNIIGIDPDYKEKEEKKEDKD